MSDKILKIKTNTLIILFALGPTLLTFCLQKEYWPFTSFPMYSQKYNHFFWPKVMVAADEEPWTVLNSTKCYGTIGYVRFHFSILNLFKIKKIEAIKQLGKAVAEEAKRNCQEIRISKMRIEIFEYKTSFPNYEKKVATAIDEVRVE